ncbi:MAG: 3'-5' exonuclease [Burkholderiales bacterium]|nr:3'-5' exonuclease [Burkholderiales bacterium]
MKPALFYDTETTGLPLFSEPSEDPRQPHIVQLAACLIDIDTRTMIAGMDVIVRPDGWTIPDEVAQIHGITTEKAIDLGVGENVALSLFLDLWGSAAFRVGHNESFDARIAMKRHLPYAMSDEQANALADTWKAGSAECTARLATPICALPPTEKMKAARRFHSKTPNLQEAFRHFFGREFEDSHSANADVQACIAVYFAIKDQMAAQQAEQPAQAAA